MATHVDALNDAIAADHRDMYDQYDQYVAHAGDRDAQQRWANQLTWEVARHAVGEEIVVCPLMEKCLGPKGVEIANSDRNDHQYVKEGLYRLESMQVGTPAYDAVLKDVMDHLRIHGTNEEEKDLPTLTRELGKDGSEEAAVRFKRTKKFVPTRPHPGAPNEPPFETLVGFMTAPIDKLRDAFAKFPTEEEKQASTASTKN